MGRRAIDSDGRRAIQMDSRFLGLLWFVEVCYRSNGHNALADRIQDSRFPPCTETLKLRGTGWR